MAIKVGGTTVIDDSRALTNIASVDATTVAALGTAGVGGGGGVVSMQASGGNISTGDFVSLNTDGTITAIDVAGGDNVVKISLNPNAQINSSDWHFLMDAQYDSANSRLICLVYSKPNNYAAITIGTVSNGKVTAWTSNTELHSNDPATYDHKNGNLVYNSTNNFWLATFTRYSPGEWLHHAAFTVNSSNVVTKLSDVEIGNYYWTTSKNARSNWDSSLNRFISGSWSEGNLAAKFKNFNYSTASSSPQSNVNEVTINDLRRYGSTNGPAGVIMTAYTDGNTFTDLRLRAFYPSTAGNAPSSSSATGILTGNSYNVYRNPVLAYNDDDDEYVCLYPQTDPTYGIWCIPFKFNKSTNSFTTNSAVKIASDITNNDEKFSVVWDSNRQRYVMSFDGSGVFGTNSTINVASFTASATTGTVSTATYDYLAFTNDRTNRLFYNDALGSFLNPDQHANLISGAQTRVPTWAGIAKENITSGSSGDIFVLSGVSPDQSGLTPRSVYYLDPATNALTTTATDTYKIGKALTSTKLLITEGNA
jgi:hypothetical protein